MGMLSPPVTFFRLPEVSHSKQIWYLPIAPAAAPLLLLLLLLLLVLLLLLWPAVNAMDPPEGQAQGPTVKNTPAVDPALGVGLDGDIDGIRDHGALVVRTGASMDGGPARPARESFAASDAPDASRETSFASGQSRGKSGSTPSVQQQQGQLRSAGPLSGVGVGVGGGGGDGGGGDAAAGDDDMTDKADTVGLEWGVDRGDGGGVGDEKKGAVSTSKDVGAGGSTPQVCCVLWGCGFDCWYDIWYLA